jgi:hypothetical protein
MQTADGFNIQDVDRVHVCAKEGSGTGNIMSVHGEILIEYYLLHWTDAKFLAFAKKENMDQYVYEFKEKNYK